MDKTLCAAAVAARARAHCRYSNFAVGAAIQTITGEVFTGCNVENASYGLTICAERVAIGSAVTAGFREFAHLALATDSNATPCGACRQVLAEFCDDLPILIHNVATGQSRTLMLADLLPHQFRFDTDRAADPRSNPRNK